MGSTVSGHCPLLLGLDAEFTYGKLFRFEYFWTKPEGFFQTVTEAVNSILSDRNPYVALDSKLRATTKKVQSWRDRWIENVKLQISIALDILRRLDMAMDERQLSQEEYNLRWILKQKLLGHCSLERSIARQRSRLSYLHEGDANTSFSH